MGEEKDIPPDESKEAASSPDAVQQPGKPIIRDQDATQAASPDKESSAGQVRQTAPIETTPVIKPSVEAGQKFEKDEEPKLPSTAESMEIHHPHHHHSRKWKDFLFEFLLLFLAVTAGFFVENEREHYIERKRANQYSKQLLADLRVGFRPVRKQKREY